MQHGSTRVILALNGTAWGVEHATDIACSHQVACQRHTLWPGYRPQAAMIRLLLRPTTDAAQEDGSGKVIAFEAQEVEFPAGDEGYETQEAVERLQVQSAAAPTHQ